MQLEHWDRPVHATGEFTVCRVRLVCLCIYEIYLSTSSAVCMNFYMHDLPNRDMFWHLNSALRLSVCAHYTTVYAWICISLLFCMHCMHNSLYECLLFCPVLGVFVWHYWYLPSPSGGVAAGSTREGKEQWMTLTGNVLQKVSLLLGQWELMADSRCVSNCRGVGHPGYVSVSSVSACQEAKPPPKPPITALIRGLISVNHCFFRSSLRPAARITG